MTDPTCAPAPAAAAPRGAPCADTTGVILAGGQARRMGGADKGLQTLGGQPLALLALRRLRPQVAHVAISANRNLQAYRQWCPQVWPDDGFDARQPRFEGPLAGMLAALARSGTPFVQLAACDTPFFPLDLAARLRARLEAGQAGQPLDVALPATVDEDGVAWRHPAFALLRRELLPSLHAFMARGERKAMRWIEQQRHAVLAFPEQAAFANFNTPEDLDRARAGPGAAAG